MKNRLILAGVMGALVLNVVCVQNASAQALDSRSPAWKKSLATAVNDGTKIGGILQALPKADRAAFAGDVLSVLQSKRQYMSDSLAWSNEVAHATAALIDGAGDAHNDVVAEIFVAADISALGLISQAVSDTVNQRKNGLNDADYLQNALKTLQTVESRTAGKADALTRFAYALAALIDASINPKQFEQDIFAKLDSLLAKLGTTKENLAHALANAQGGVGGNGGNGGTSGGSYPTLRRPYKPFGGGGGLQDLGNNNNNNPGANPPDQTTSGYQNQKI